MVEVGRRKQESGAGAGQVFKLGNESRLTYSLKWAAWEWLYTFAGCRSIGFEVKLEGPGGRIVDLAAVGPGNTIYIVEVKASRADFSRDNHTFDDLEALKELNEPLLRRGRLARRTLTQATHYAQEARSDDWEREPSYQLALADYQRLRKEEQTYRDRVSTFSVKFHDPRFLGIADYHYIMAPRKLVPARQIPPQWGLLNELLELVGLGEWRNAWLGDTQTALAAIIFAWSWQQVGMSMVIFLAGLTEIPRFLYDAARVDGASRWQQFRHVTVPMLRNTLVFVTVMTVIGSFQVFTSVYIMTSGGPERSTEVIAYSIFINAFAVAGQMGYASALAWLLFAATFVFVFLQMRLFRSRRIYDE